MGSICDGQVDGVAALAADAATEGLVLYVGAGVSMAPPTNLPSGDEVAARVCALLVQELDDPPQCESEDLVSIADKMEPRIGGMDMLRTALVRSANYLSAEPNLGHVAIAMLFLEGAVDVVTTNWDDCIERGASPERLQVVVSDGDQLSVSSPTIFKIHGCASRQDSLKVTTNELANPNPWARTQIFAKVGERRVVFLGVGHIAETVRSRLKEMIEHVTPLSNLRLVSPHVSDDWETSPWAALVPGLTPDHRFNVTAEHFAVSLLNAYCGRALNDAEGLIDAGRASFTKVRSALCEFDGADFVRWFRKRAIDVLPGQSTVHSDNGKRSLVALAYLSGESLEAGPDGVVTDGGTVDLLFSPSVLSARDFRGEAARRATSRKLRGKPLPAAFVCSGVIGPLPRSLGKDILDPEGGDDDDIVAGPLDVDVALIDADDLIKGNA